MAKQKTNKGLKDPAEIKAESEGADALDAEFEGFDPDKQPAAQEDELTFEEVGAVKEKKTVAPHPFDGYPLARQVPLVVPESADPLKVSATFIVMMKPHEEPEEDISNKGNTIYISGNEGGGGDPKSGKPKIVNFPTSHTRVVRARGGDNITVVFDREIKVSGQVYRCAIVREHSVRAQLIFEFDMDKNKIKADKRYLLADLNQITKLRDMFKAIKWQQTKHNNKADQFDAAQEGSAAPRDLVTNEGIDE